MRVLLVVCHPNPRSFSHAVANRIASECAERSTELIRHDLYAEGFDPVLSGPELARRTSLDPIVQQHSRDVRSADHFVFVHPDWWSGAPAVLKGWIDRVFRPGVAYDWVGDDMEEKHHAPLLGGTAASVFVTTDRSEDDPPLGIRAFWTELCAYSGIGLNTLMLMTAMRASTLHQRRAWLEAAAAAFLQSIPTKDEEGH